MALPSRIWIVGPCGAGKSAVARLLADRLGVNAIHLDDLYWKPGWVQSSVPELADRVDQVVCGHRWVIDGNYSRVRRLFHDRVQLYVWLDLPLWLTFPRVLVRSLRRWARHEPCCNGNYETLRRSFVHRDSLLWWSLTTDHSRRLELAEELSNLPHVRLRSQLQLDDWLRRDARVSQNDQDDPSDD